MERRKDWFASMLVPGPAEGGQEQDSQTERDSATDFGGVLSPGRTKEYPPSDVDPLGSLSPQPEVGESPRRP